MNYKWLGMVAVVLWVAVGQAHAQVVINEVFQNPPGSSDDRNEYIELLGRPGMDLTGYAIALLKGGRDIDNDGLPDGAISEDAPEIDEAFSLDGLTLGANGFLVVYNDTNVFPSQILPLLPVGANAASFTATHIPTSDTVGNLSNDTSSTYVLVRKRPNHQIVGGLSQYDAGYGFRKDVMHDVDFDGEPDVGTETPLPPIVDAASMVDPYQMVDDFAFSHEGGKEYVRDPQQEITETPGFNPDAASRLRYLCLNPGVGHTTNDAGVILPTTLADESWIYGEVVDIIDYGYNTAIDIDGFISTKGPTDTSAAPYDGSCDPEPLAGPDPACLPNATGHYYFTDLDFSGFELTPGDYNDHPTDGDLLQFRFVAGDFNFDGALNTLDRLLIEARYNGGVGAAALDDVAVDGVWVWQGKEFQQVLMMLEMDLTDGDGGANAETVTQDDVDAFLALCGGPCTTGPSGAMMRITEYQYTGNGGEFVEFTNLGATPIDLTAWSYDDDSGTAGMVSLSAFGTAQPGESVILTESDPGDFATQWGLSGVKIIGLNTTGNLSRNDQINLYDASGTLVDTLTYGDQDIPGTIRTNDISGWPCQAAVGADDISGWVLSVVGDAQGSVLSAAGDVGNPGAFIMDDCATPPATGACCIAGVCQDGSQVSEAFCVASGGLYQGDASRCSALTCPQPSDAIVRITEYLYSGADGEFFEITNLDSEAVDLTGWSFDDNSAVPTTIDLSGLGTLLPGESAIVTETPAATFSAAWGLAGVAVVGDSSANLGRNDEINLYDAAGVLVDRLTYGDEDFPGTIRTQNASGWPCTAAIGQNDIFGWQLSALGDAQPTVASSGGDLGSPGGFVIDDCGTPAPTGACCSAGECTPDLTPLACAAQGGDYAGDDVTCEAAACPAPSAAAMRITEYMYSGNSSEYIEFTNLGADPVDMTGWSFDDDSRLPGTTDLSAFGVVMPGQSVILSEDPAELFEASWNLAGVPVIGVNKANLGRNDEINLYDHNDQLVDRLTYGDEVFPGTIRTQFISGWPCAASLGANDIFGWVFSSDGDSQESHTSAEGDLGSPGLFATDACENTCPADLNGSGAVDAADLAQLLGAWGPCPGCTTDLNGSGAVDASDLAQLLGAWGDCP